METHRWYMLNKMGMATLCLSEKDAKKDARAMDMAWPHMGPHRAVQLVEAADVDRAMRSAQPAPENIRSILVRCRDFIDTTKAPAYPAGADLADEIDVLLAAQPEPAAVVGPSRQFTDGTRSLRQDCISAIRDFASSRPEDDEDWESWFEAAFGLCESRLSTIFDEHAAAPDTQPAPAAVAGPHVTDAMALAFHSALSDGAIGSDEVEDIKTGLRAALNAAPDTQPSPAAQGDALDAAFEAVRKNLCALPRYSFVLDDDGLVRRVQDRTGNWIEFDEAHALFDPVAVDAARKQGGA